MERKLDNYSLLGIVKLIAYQRGIIVPNELFKKLKESAYSGYRTTSGIFIKIGGTLSKEEFKEIQENGKVQYLADDNVKEMSYEEYLKNREWVTAPIFSKSSITSEILEDSFLALDYSKDGRLSICGQYIGKDGQKQTFKLNDTAIFLQGNYDDDKAVAVQAGGIRMRVSICGSNCISGCSFCSFGSGSQDYINKMLSEERLDNEIKPAITEIVAKYGISHLFITGGNPSLNDMEQWTKYLIESIKTFKASLKQFGIKEDGAVDVMLTPRDENSYLASKSDYKRYLEKLRDYGVNTISPNMEIWSQDKLMEFCPPNAVTEGVTKSEIGHNRYLDFIEAAVEVFGKFNVRSALIVGLNSIEETKEAIDVLINKGCYVTLSPFKAPECVQNSSRYNRDLSGNEPSYIELVELSEYLQKAIKKYLESLPPEERAMCETNIDKSLNAHNSHNTANLCAGRKLDRLEQKGYEKGIDHTIVNNVFELNRESKGLEDK